VDKLIYHLRRFALLITTLSDNAIFVAALATIPDIHPKWLIIAHLVAMVAKSYYYMDKTTVKVEESEKTVIQEKIVSKPIEPNGSAIDLWDTNGK
jgi:hypothetical protein